MAYFVRRPVAPNHRHEFRQAVREDFRSTCAYCLIEEFHAAGLENFEVDHFWPKSKFPEREWDFYNLRWSCHPCNLTKRDKHPCREAKRRVCLVDLCQSDFSEHFRQLPTGEWRGKTPAADWTIDAVRLNRPHLVALRKKLQRLAELSSPPMRPETRTPVD